MNPDKQLDLLQKAARNLTSAGNQKPTREQVEMVRSHSLPPVKPPTTVNRRQVLKPGYRWV